MPPENTNLRLPSPLEVIFYHELLAPLHAYLETSQEDPDHRRAATLLAIRFKIEIARYGYFITEHGMMVQIEPDILGAPLTVAQLSNSARDMKILRRMMDKW